MGRGRGGAHLDPATWRALNCRMKYERRIFNDAMLHEVHAKSLIRVVGADAVDVVRVAESMNRPSDDKLRSNINVFFFCLPFLCRRGAGVSGHDAVQTHGWRQIRNGGRVPAERQRGSGSGGLPGSGLDAVTAALRARLM